MTPFEKAAWCDVPEVMIKDMLEHYSDEIRKAFNLPPDAEVTREQALKTIHELALRSPVFKNDKYQVVVEPWGADFIHLSIRRLDREPIHDWRELQQIKNMLVGPENEAVELYPAESRVLDTANQFHLWVLKDSTLKIPVGYTEGARTDIPLGQSKQRPFGE